MLSMGIYNFRPTASSDIEELMQVYTLTPSGRRQGMYLVQLRLLRDSLDIEVAPDITEK